MALSRKQGSGYQGYREEGRKPLGQPSLNQLSRVRESQAILFTQNIQESHNPTLVPSQSGYPELLP